MLHILLFSVILVASALGIGCPSGCECNDETYVVNCERNKLDVFPIALNPAVQRLVLRNNKIKTFDAAFPFYRELQYVDLSSNHLVNLPVKSFQYQEKLQELHLSDNKLSNLNNQTFLGLKSLTVLNLRENFLEELPRGLFSILPKLEELNLGKNRITKIDALAFDGLVSLRVLYLDDNLLTTVPTESFSVMNGLAELHIGMNDFTTLPDASFNGLNKLIFLDLRGAGLSNITATAFSNIIGLRHLNLADNRLVNIPTQQLAHMTRLEDLVLGQNDFIRIGPNAFRGLSNLRKLEITGAAHLEQIEKGAFSENLNIETIILASNRQLKEIEDGAMVGLPNLRHLVLRETGLKMFPENMLSWSELKTLELSDNPVYCDCQLLWLGNLLAVKNLTTVHCIYPLHLRDKPLKTLSADDLGCSFRDPKQQAMIITLGVSSIVLIGFVAVLLFRYRQRVKEALKEYKWNKRAISRKEHEYQKTFSEDEYIMRAAQAAHIKPIPVTEL